MKIHVVGAAVKSPGRAFSLGVPRSGMTTATRVGAGVDKLTNTANHAWRTVMVAALVVAAGCAHYPVNDPLARHDPAAGYRVENLPDAENSGSLLVVLTFSGGGTRAAALAYGVLEQLARVEVEWEGRHKRLLDEVDLISAVSGGSYTAAYYALHRDRLFMDFEPDFLKRDVQGDITRKLLAPGNVARASAPMFGRIDLVAEYLDDNLFHGATYGDLLQSGLRPFVLINASDMSLGTRFEFTQDQFDPICSDLSSYPIARAVAASSAVPIAFSPLTLRNHAGQCGYEEPAWVQSALANRAASSRRYYKASELRSYMDADKRPYIHLLDGGISDNTGMRGLLDRMLSETSPQNFARSLRAGDLQKVVLITVSAETRPDMSLDRVESVPTMFQVLRNVKDIPINHNSFETAELFRARFENMARTEGSGIDGPPVDFYLIEVALEGISDKVEREQFMRIPTSLRLPGESVDRVKAMAARLLMDSAEFGRLLRDLGHPQETTKLDSDKPSVVDE